MIYSDFQHDIFDSVRSGSGHVVVNAGPGSGKTTTAIESLKYTPESANVRFVAYNAHIAAEMKKRAVARADVRTLHSLGNQALYRSFGRLKIDEFKVEKIIDRLLHFDPFNSPLSKPEFKRLISLRYSLTQLTSLAKNTLFDVTDPEAIEDAADHFEISMNGDSSEIYGLLPKVLKASTAELNSIDFDDMCFLPIALDLPIPDRSHYLFVDELQDVNAVQTELIVRALARGGRAFGIGDPLQSLYGFRGADVRAIQNFTTRFDATTLPLQITYRCPRKHVELARTISPSLTCRPDAPNGILSNMHISSLSRTVRPGDRVICRTNAPLVEQALEVISNGTRAVIRGKDGFGKGLKTLLARQSGETVRDVIIELSDYLESERDRLLSARKFSQLQSIEDRVTCLLVILSKCRSIDEAFRKIQTIFDDDLDAVIFSTVHGAKGLEAERIFLLRPDLIPHSRAKLPWQIEQEVNVLFVAITRSKSELYFVRE